MRKILVTTALPYANGSLHLGHLVDNIQADTWVRFQRMQGHECHFISGCDAHGTPIMIQAEKLKIKPATLVAQLREEHHRDLKDFLVDLDNYYTTDSAENRELVDTIFTRHLEASNIHKRVIKQAYDPEKNMFLPDRFIKGDCPRCSAKDQYGDSCEVCGATYSPTELKNAYSTLSGAKPIEKESEHYFFKLQNYENVLKDWTRSGHLQEQVSNKLDEWFKAGLQEWDISRDAPYFGFKIPGEEEKYYYCWLDAPVGYMASFKNLCSQQSHLNFDEYWQQDSKAELYHFIGKDIVYFHALFWPAVLSGAQYRTPTAIFVHGFVTIDGQKMSKSRGTFIKARTYLDHLNPEYVRYYLAAKLSSHIEDIDINFNDFMNRVNSDLVGKFVNIASRTASFLTRSFSGQLSSRIADLQLYQKFVDAGQEIANKWNKLDYSQAIRQIMALADTANQYIDEKKPWALCKDASRLIEVQEICTMGINLFRILAIYLKPVLPHTVRQIENFLNISELSWHDSQNPLLNHTIQEYHPLLVRIEEKQIEALKKSAASDIEATKPSSTSAPDSLSKETISIDDFAKIDLRVAKITAADHVEGADKLLRLEVDLGNQKRQIFAGIKSAYQPEQLIGQFVVVVANLAPRKMRFGLSEGMVLAASSTSGDLLLVSPGPKAIPGMVVK
jgi:methionyl-tRNA synthetase